MFRSSLLRSSAIKIVLQKEVTNFKHVRCITCICRPSRKKMVFRQKNFNLWVTQEEQVKTNLRFYCNYPSFFKVLLPALSPTMEFGTIISWEKKEGDKLNEGDLLAEIETDKATMGFETPEEGYLAKILVPAGSKNVPIGKLVCIIVENEADIAAFKNYVDSEQASPPAPKPSSKSTAPPPPSPSPPPPPPPPKVPPPLDTQTPQTPQTPSFTPGQSSSRVYASPLAKKLAAEQGITLKDGAKGSGIFGSIKSKDLAAVSQSSAELPQTQASSQDIHEITASLELCLLDSKKAIPHYYLTMDVLVDNITALIKKINTLNEKNDIKLSVNDFIIKAVALACKKVPEANSSWKDTFIRQYNTVNVNITISTEKGTFTPVLFDADSKGLAAISSDVRALTEKAREGKLEPNELQVGTVSVSNLGMYGINNFSSIIYPPQSCILSVGGLEERLVPDSQNERGYRKAEFISVTLSCDHRVLDGAVGARWLQIFRDFMENPDFMLL